MASTKTVIAAAAVLTAAVILKSRGDRADKPIRQVPTPPRITPQLADRRYFG